MTRLETTQETTAAALERFRYGWRYVRHEHPVNGYIYEQIPLTLEDVLYPEVGDFIVHSKAHEEICHYLTDVFRVSTRHDPTAVILHDVRVAWDVEGLRPNGPDITVLFGVQVQRNWSTFDCAEEGVRPALVVEVTSPDTRHQDLVDKLDIYEEAGVGQYLIVDTRQVKGREMLSLRCYELIIDRFQECRPNETGQFWLQGPGVWVGIRNSQIECYDQNNALIDRYTHLHERYMLAEQQTQLFQNEARREAEARAIAETQARQAETQARQESQARAAAEARLRELEAELARLRAEM